MKLFKKEISENIYEERGYKYTTTTVDKYFLNIKYSSKSTTLQEDIEIKYLINKVRGHEIKVEMGKKYISVSNEPGENKIVEVIDFMKITQARQPIAVIKDVDSEKEFIAFSLLIPYEKEVYEYLNRFKPIEQYNLLVSGYHQIPEKYGKKYQTFEEQGYRRKYYI